MKEFIPKIFLVMKNYEKKQAKKDVTSGIMVAIIAFPLSIAFAMGSGLSPITGIYTAIISSLIIALFGGSSVQIAGPTGAFMVIIQSIITSYGLQGLMISTIFSGIILILMGIFKLGKLIKFIPTPIVTGFTGGIAITIFTLEFKDFLGFTIPNMPKNFFQKWVTYFHYLDKINYVALFIGLLSLIIMIYWPKINKTIPNSLIAILVSTLLTILLKLDISTLGTMDTAITIPEFAPQSFSTYMELIEPAISIALLVAMQALFSAVVTDDLINCKHSPNMELIANGISNLFLGFLSLMPSTGGVARSIANVKNGGRTPIAAITHSISLFIFIYFLMPILKFIPMSTLAAILIVTAFNMFNIKEFMSYRKAPISDSLILITSCILTFSFHLILAIEVGMLITLIFFVKRMSEESSVKLWYDKNSVVAYNDDKELKDVPKNTLVYEMNGPLFFATASHINHILHSTNPNTKHVILRMKGVTAMDVTALKTLKGVHGKLRKQGINLIVSHVMKQPYEAMEKVGLIEEIGEDNICENIDLALKRAAGL